MQFSFDITKQKKKTSPVHLVDDRCTPASSFVTKWASRISPERLDLASPNFTRTSTPVRSITTPDMTSLTTSSWQLSKFKKRSKMSSQTASCEIPRERFKRGSPNFTRLSGTTGPTNLSDMIPLAASGWRQNAIKYCTTVVRKTCPADHRVK